MRYSTALLPLAAAALLLAACTGEEPASTTATTLPPSGAALSTTTTTVTATTPVTTAAPSTTSGPSTTVPTPVPASGPATADCVDGWIEPVPGDPLYDDAVALLGTAGGLTWEVDRVRAFTGPEDTGVLEPVRTVQRWYVEVHVAGDPATALRILLRRVDVGAGLAAVAPGGTTGATGPPWVAFDGEGAPPAPVAGLPGEWSGEPYDYDGIPAENRGCLA